MARHACPEAHAATAARLDPSVRLDENSRCRIALIPTVEVAARSVEIILEQPSAGTGGLRGPGKKWSSPLDPIGHRNAGADVARRAAKRHRLAEVLEDRLMATAALLDQTEERRHLSR